MSKAARLAEIIHEHCPRDGSHQTAIGGLYLTRYSTPDVPRTSGDQAVFCVVAQGSKSTFLNGERFRYDPDKFLLVSMDLPLVGQIEEASWAKPFLGLSLVLDFGEIGSLLSDAKIPNEMAAPCHPALILNAAETDLMDAVIRLAGLLKKPAQLSVLAPLVKREIYYQLLVSQQSSVLRRMVGGSAKVQRIAAGIAWLKKNLREPIRMQELAREMRMSPSAMHSWFRTVTSMSPLQYQKQLRLQEARRLLLSDAVDAGTASRRVGYGSASQFSREYRRLFGKPPMQDVKDLLAGLAS